MNRDDMLQYIIDNELYYVEEDGDYLVSVYQLDDQDPEYVSIFELEDDELQDIIDEDENDDWEHTHDEQDLVRENYDETDVDARPEQCDIDDLEDVD